MLSLSPFTPAVQPNDKGEIYAAESFYSRGNRGERTDVLSAYDAVTLTPSFEVKIPNKVAGMLPFRQYIALMDDSTHVAVFNMTPAQSVSIVNVKDREFVGEISTPGCGLIMPVTDRSFLMICGDGTLQRVSLNAEGEESGRVRSESFFEIDGDPVFDKPIPSNDGWQLVSYEGLTYEVSAQGDGIKIGEPWSLLSDEDRAEQWRVGGGQLIDLHLDKDLLFILVHQGGIDTHSEPGTEIWIFNRANRQRIARIQPESHVANLLVTQDEDPILITTTVEDQIVIYDVNTTRKLRTIENPGLSPWLLQSFPHAR